MHAPHLLLPVGGLSSHSTWPEEALWLIQSWPYYHFKIVSKKYIRWTIYICNFESVKFSQTMLHGK